MGNNFYKLFEKIQKLKEQDEMNKPSDAGMQPSITGTDEPSNDDPMQLGTKDNVSAEIEDTEDAADTEDSDNLSLPEGSIDFDKIMMDLNKIKKMIPKFKSMDKDKGDQLEDLLKQTSNLVSSFSPEGEESESEDQNADNIMKDEEPSFGDEQGPPMKQTANMEDMPKDMSSEMPAMNPADQMQQ